MTRHIEHSTQLIHSVSKTVLGGPESIDWLVAGSWVADKLVAPAVTGLIIALVASYLIPRINEKAKSRSDSVRANAASLDQEISSLLDLSSVYWSVGAAEADLVNAGRIEFSLSKIAALLEVLAPEVLVEESAHLSLMTNLLEAVTGSQFAAVDRRADLKRVRAISAAASALENEIIVRIGDFHSGRNPTGRGCKVA